MGVTAAAMLVKVTMSVNRMVHTSNFSENTNILSLESQYQDGDHFNFFCI